ncbi:staphylopine family metallophore export MFS transporter CntE [Saccharibacillus alkalitolerans]|uniref:MFS transporter n=1 Tax=Saccharibacillus alkalitolerans TaxID=2705290 RepID=A0ABX0FAW5_9BACL|nr:MFS transporter [Saccharibacillus alkalitolerans]NGZ77100.1 MFS transporter [Saccharibacillus alkalitolerans]
MKGAMSWPFLRLYLLALLYFSGNSILNVIIPLKGAEEGASSTAIGLIMGAYMFTTMFFRPWAGHFIPKYGSIRILRSILLVNGISLVLYAMVGLEVFVVARIMQGICTAFFSMALQIGILDALPEEDRSQGISMYSLFSYIPGIAGPLLALGIWQNGGASGFALTMTGIAVLTAVFGYTVRGSEVEQPASKRQGEEKMPAEAGGIRSFGQLLRNPHLLKCSLLMLTASVVFGAVTTFMPLYAREVRSGHAGIYLMLQAAALVGMRFAWRKRMPSDGRWHTRFMVVTLLLLTFGAAGVSAALAGGVWFLYAGAVLIGTSQALLYPTLMAYLSSVLPKANRNVLIGLFIASADLGTSLGGVLMGPLADLFSYSGMYAACAVLAGSAILGAYGRKTNQKGLPA